ncbi:MBL fold metallo-hydrolase [Clostridium sp. DL1XJH146]
MKLSVLLDNNTFIDRYFYGEPGVSYFIQDKDINILFDAGYSDAFIRNAQKMQIDLKTVDSVVISHGHIDHTLGLLDLIKLYTEAAIEKIDCKKPNLIAHPLAFLEKRMDDEVEIGSMITEEKLSKHFSMNLSKEPLWITDKLVFLGEIERKNDFENREPIGKVQYKDHEIDDFVLDDSAMVYKTKEGLVIITGCSHSGICNIIQYSKKVCNDERIIDVIGGFHLLNPAEETIKGTCEYIKENNIKRLHACHCTDLKSKIELSKIANVEEVGVGLVLEY